MSGEAAKQKVRCAVVVPTRDRPGPLGRALAALLAQTHPAELLELIVVDDGSSPPLTPDALTLPDGRPAGLEKGRGGPKVSLVSSHGGGPAAARNAGAQRARGCDLILFTDDDAAPSDGWVAAMAAAHVEQRGAALAGPVAPISPRNPYSAAYEAIDRAARRGQLRSGRSHISGANLAVPAARFAELGGFDPDYIVSEDRNLGERWQSRGWPLLFRQDAVVAHEHPETLGEFWSTFVRYGRGAHRFHRAGRRMRGRNAGIRASASTLAAAVSGCRSARELALVAVWQVATIAGFTEAALGSAIHGRRTRPSP